MRRLDRYLLLLFVLSGLVFTPLFAPGYFYDAHDGQHSVFYLSMFDASIRDGAWWPRWAMHHIQGYGYPTFIIQAPLGFYLAELFVLLGAGYTLAAKLAWATGALASAWGMYALVVVWSTDRHHGLPDEFSGDPAHRELRARLAGVAAALLYVYVPYHLVGMYVRAALNDTLLFAWYPWVLLAFDRLVVYGRAPGWPRRLAVAGLVLAGALLTHTFALISFAPLLVLFVLFRLGLLGWTARGHAGGRVRQLADGTLLALAGGVSALLLCAAFLLPLLVEGPDLQQQVYSTGSYDFRNHFVYPGQFLSPFWGFGYSDDPTGAADGMSFQVGVMASMVVIGAVFLLWRGSVSRRGYMLFLLVSTLLLLLLITPAAAPIWNRFPILGIIQFPWRLLSLVAVTTSALGGLTVVNLLAREESTSGEIGATLVFGLLAVLASAGYIGADLQPVEAWREDGRAVSRFEQEHPDMIAYTRWVREPFNSSPMTAEYAADDYREEHGDNPMLTRLAVISGDGAVLSNESRGASGGGVVRMETPGVVRVHLLYFPGWQAYLDGARVSLRVSDPHGLIELDVPAGEHRIDVRMEATPVRRTGTLVSWGMLILLVASAAWPVGGWRRKGKIPGTPKDRLGRGDQVDINRNVD